MLLVAILGSSVAMSNVKAPKFFTLILLPARRLLFRYSTNERQTISIYAKAKRLMKKLPETLVQEVSLQEKYVQ